MRKTKVERDQIPGARGRTKRTELGIPLAESIVRLSAEVSKLGGRLCVDLSPTFLGSRDRASPAGVNVIRVLVVDYTPEELNELLRQRKIDIDKIPEHVRTFIRNPPSARSH